MAPALTIISLPGKVSDTGLILFKAEAQMKRAYANARTERGIIDVIEPKGSIQ